MKNYRALLLLVFATSCNTIDLYEKTKSFSNHRWASSEKPTFNFDIGDTTVPYNIFIVFRHTDAYNFNNLWLNVTTIPPGDTATKQQLDLKLADNNKGWLGSGMDDIFEHRIQITRSPVLLRKGKYQFMLQQIMREDPLENVMNAGIRVEKVK